jgi:hypothetical protein
VVQRRVDQLAGGSADSGDDTAGRSWSPPRLPDTGPKLNRLTGPGRVVVVVADEVGGDGGCVVGVLPVVVGVVGATVVVVVDGPAVVGVVGVGGAGDAGSANV